MMICPKCKNESVISQVVYDAIYCLVCDWRGYKSQYKDEKEEEEDDAHI